MKSTIQRTIGVEIECLVDCASRVFMDSISKLGGEVKSDGSIDGDGDGIEVVTNPIKGDDAENTIRGLCEALGEAGATVNASTGLHVHVDAKEIAPQKLIKRLIGSDTPVHEPLYIPASLVSGDSYSDAVLVIGMMETAKFKRTVGKYGYGRVIDSFETRNIGDRMTADQEGDFSSFDVDGTGINNLKTRMFNAMRFFAATDMIFRGLVPSSRRHNTYCQPFEKITGSGGAMPQKYSDLVDKTTQRYCGINLIALQRHGTVEVRYHTGSVNADKIIHWARLCERVVDRALSRTAATDADILAEVVNGKNRLEMLCAMVDLPEDTANYLIERHTAFMGSDARHAIAYISRVKRNRVCVE